MIREKIIIYMMLCLFRVYSQTIDTNPAFTNIALCGCDLTEARYDNNCCCDSDGSASDVAISSCIPGPFGGNFTTLDDRLCATSQAYVPDWFLFTCIQFLNSPDLGLYYFPSTAPSPDLATDELSYSVIDVIASTFSCGTMQYNASDPILAAYATAGGGCESVILRFPQQSLAGDCLRQSPMRYLQSSSASCDVTVTSQLCGSGTILDAAFYTTAQVRSQTTQAGTVTYTCANDVDNSAFVKTNTGSADADGDNLFQSSGASEPVPCNYQTPTPSAAGDFCENVVASVSYTFVWNASNITGFDIQITLANASYTTLDSIASGGPSNVLTQTFVAAFAPSNSAAAVSRSGFPGYELGLPVISASDDGATEVNRSMQLTVWKPGSSGLCADASLVAPAFGYDSVSGCVVTFGFLNCTGLRSLVETQQLQLLQANRVSRFGNPSNTASSDDWIPVISNITSFTESENSTEGQCEGIPSRVMLEIMWARSGYENGMAIREIVGTRASLSRETWDIRCIDGQTPCDVSSYALYSTVVYTEVPPQAPTPATSYELNRNDTCKKDATCWGELLLPIQSEFFYLYSTTAAETLRTYNYAWTLFVTFFSITAVFVPANWGAVGRYLKQVLPI